MGAKRHTNPEAEKFHHPLSRATGSAPINTGELDEAFGQGPRAMREARYQHSQINLSEWEPKKEPSRAQDGPFRRLGLMALVFATGVGVTFISIRWPRTPEAKIASPPTTVLAIPPPSSVPSTSAAPSPTPSPSVAPPPSASVTAPPPPASARSAGPRSPRTPQRIEDLGSGLPRGVETPSPPPRPKQRHDTDKIDLVDEAKPFDPSD